jgi:hypothetical protein
VEEEDEEEEDEEEMEYELEDEEEDGPLDVEYVEVGLHVIVVIYSVASIEICPLRMQDLNLSDDEDGEEDIEQILADYHASQKGLLLLEFAFACFPSRCLLIWVPVFRGQA